ncbi:DUF3426 domain-containing protein [Thermomonas sp. HDW16]|uniref:DUF3426 domain-containing protein n=1 Tax=Thermomonas sp. HDW16 TaxID=2714945 RepID=UPI001F0F67CA|nr:DUF3426 domain-containing protein [Thermomonas sp. HDW16]
MSRAPSFIREAAPPRSRRGEWIALALLLLVLLAQLFFSQRAQLAADARWRPLVITTCGALGCSVPAWHEPTAFSMLSRDVIAVPGRPGVLRVQASFRNDAAWPQPWPALVLMLSNAEGRQLGARRFQPRDYLGDAPKDALLVPGQATQLAFDIVEPAAGIVAFDFRFE